MTDVEIIQRALVVGAGEKARKAAWAALGRLEALTRREPARPSDDAAFNAAMGLNDAVASLRERTKRLEAFVNAFAVEAEAAVAHHESKGRGGQQVPFHGPFGHAPPSTVSHLRWLAREAREALKP